MLTKVQIVRRCAAHKRRIDQHLEYNKSLQLASTELFGVSFAELKVKNEPYVELEPGPVSFVTCGTIVGGYQNHGAWWFGPAIDEVGQLHKLNWSKA